MLRAKVGLKIIGSIRPERFELGQAILALGETHAGEQIPMKIFAKGQSTNPVQADFAKVKAYVEDQGHGVLLRWSVVFFWIGILISTFGPFVFE